MAQVSILVTFEGASEPVPVRVPDDAPLSLLLPVLVQRIGLVANKRDARLYRLIREDSDRPLRLNKSLFSQEIREGELVLLERVTSGNGIYSLAKRKLIAILGLLFVLVFTATTVTIFLLQSLLTGNEDSPLASETVTGAPTVPIPALADIAEIAPIAEGECTINRIALVDKGAQFIDGLAYYRIPGYPHHGIYYIELSNKCWVIRPVIITCKDGTMTSFGDSQAAQIFCDGTHGGWTSLQTDQLALNAFLPLSVSYIMMPGETLRDVCQTYVDFLSVDQCINRSLVLNGIADEEMVSAGQQILLPREAD